MGSRGLNRIFGFFIVLRGVLAFSGDQYLMVGVTDIALGRGNIVASSADSDSESASVGSRLLNLTLFRLELFDFVGFWILDGDTVCS